MVKADPQSKVVRKQAVEAAGADRRFQTLIDERRQYILGLARKNGRVLVEERSESLNISRVTMRKDLEYLHTDLRRR